MQYLTFLLPLAALAAANPLERRGCVANDCLAAVTGKAALGDGKLRAGHCASFLATTVTPPAITTTVTVAGTTSSAKWKRADVTVCPNEVPNYASACDLAGYSSACSCFGFTAVKTTTLAPTTTTKTVYVAPTGSGTGSGSCSASTVTSVLSGSVCPTAKSVSTVTVTSTTTTTTTTTEAAASATPAKCYLTDAKALSIVNNFIDLLEYTSYNGSATGLPSGRGYHFNVSAITLDANFTDISDSINFMAGFPIGSITFPSKAAFDYGQGILQPEVVVKTLNIFHDCSSITWRWSITPTVPKGAPTPLPVTGINYMIINDKGLIQKQYAEFDSGAWLQSFGRQCAINGPVAPVSPPALKHRDIDAGILPRTLHHF